MLDIAKDAVGRTGISICLSKQGAANMVQCQLSCLEVNPRPWGFMNAPVLLLMAWSLSSRVFATCHQDVGNAWGYLQLQK